MAQGTTSFVKVSLFEKVSWWWRVYIEISVLLHGFCTGFCYFLPPFSHARVQRELAHEIELKRSH